MSQPISLLLPFDEFRVWSQQIRPLVEAQGVSPDGLRIAEYVTTELLNNVVDHSQGRSASVSISANPEEIAITIEDDGIGLFRKLQLGLNLESVSDAALELTKGKTTTDPASHTGEGLFFCGRAAKWLLLRANGLGVSFDQGRASRYAFPDQPERSGTQITAHLAKDPNRSLDQVFAEFCPEPDHRFIRTIISLRLMQDIDGALVSRSQGKRVVVGLDRFEQVEFDFEGVSRMEQGFADEVFRVWRARHPDIRVTVSHANAEVAAMLKHVGYAPATH